MSSEPQESPGLTEKPVSRKSLLKTAAAAAPVLAGLGSVPEAWGRALGLRTLTVMTPYTIPGPVWQIWNEVAKPLGMRVKVVGVSGPTFAAQAAAAQLAGRSPDIYFQTTFTPRTLLATKVSLAVLDSYASSLSKAELSDSYKQDFASGTFKGKLYALATGAGCRAIAYRKDYAADAGLSSPPARWSVDQFGPWVGKLTTSRHFGFGFEAKSGDGRAVSNIAPLIWSAGGEIIVLRNNRWVLGFSQAQITRVLEYYDDLINTWRASPKDVAGWGSPETDGGFARGTLAAYSTGPFVKFTASNFPETLKNMGVAGLPTIDKPTGYWDSPGFSISGQSKYKDQAWEWIRGVRSVKAQERLITIPGGPQLSVRKSLNAKLSDPALRAFASFLPDARPIQSVDPKPLFDQAILPAIQAVVLGKATPSAAAGTLIKAAAAPLGAINFQNR